MRSPDGEEFGGGGEYVEVTPGKRLACGGDGTTTVVVTNRGLPDEKSEESHRKGWEGSLANLDRLLVR